MPFVAALKEKARQKPRSLRLWAEQNKIKAAKGALAQAMLNAQSSVHQGLNAGPENRRATAMADPATWW
jgi:hypothetical protein